MRDKLRWLLLALLIAPFIALVVLWNQIPERVPIHWNLRGQIDGWAPKTIGLVITPLIGLLTMALCQTLSWLDPKLRMNLKRTDRMNKILQILRVTFAAFFDAIFAIQLVVALGSKIAAARVIVWCVLLLFAILGNYLPNLRPNYFIGIRTPWTLENAEIWRATHHLGGKLMFFGSLLLLVLDFFLGRSLVDSLFLTFIALLVVWSFVYSWYHFRSHVDTRQSV
jgi:immunity protein, SdpI family